MGSHLSPRFALYLQFVCTTWNLSITTKHCSKWKSKILISESGNIIILYQYTLSLERYQHLPFLSIFLLFQWRDNFWWNFNCLSNCCFNFHHNEEMKWYWIFCSLVNWIHISKRKVRSQTIHVSLYWIFLPIFHTTSLWFLYAVDFFFLWQIEKTSK